MRIALDYDGTYTKAPKLWNEFIKQFQQHGHVILCVTMRYNRPDERIFDDMHGIDVIYTGRQAKARYLLEQNIKIDIWIDDNPIWIYQDS